MVDGHFVSIWLILECIILYNMSILELHALFCSLSDFSKYGAIFIPGPCSILYYLVYHFMFLK